MKLSQLKWHVAGMAEKDILKKIITKEQGVQEDLGFDGVMAWLEMPDPC